MPCFAHLGVISCYSPTGYKCIAIFFLYYLFVASRMEEKKRVRINRSRNEAEGQSVKINNTSSSGLSGRVLYLADRFRRNSYVLAWRAWWLEGLSPWQQEFSIQTVYILVDHKAEKALWKQGWAILLKILPPACHFPWFGSIQPCHKRVTPAGAQVLKHVNRSFLNSTKQYKLTELLPALLWVIWRVQRNISMFLNKYWTIYFTINNTTILYFKLIQISAVFILIVSSLLSSFKQLPSMHKLTAYKLANVEHNVEIAS